MDGDQEELGSIAFQTCDQAPKAAGCELFPGWGFCAQCREPIGEEEDQAPIVGCAGHKDLLCEFQRWKEVGTLVADIRTADLKRATKGGQGTELPHFFTELCYGQTNRPSGEHRGRGNGVDDQAGGPAREDVVRVDLDKTLRPVDQQDNVRASALRRKRAVCRGGSQQKEACQRESRSVHRMVKAQARRQSLIAAVTGSLLAFLREERGEKGSPVGKRAPELLAPLLQLGPTLTWHRAAGAATQGDSTGPSAHSSFECRRDAGAPRGRQAVL